MLKRMGRRLLSLLAPLFLFAVAACSSDASPSDALTGGVPYDGGGAHDASDARSSTPPPPPSDGGTVLPPADGGTTVDAGPPTPQGCVTDVSAGDHVYTCNGLKVDARIPAACEAPGCGLILELHGDTGTGEQPLCFVDQTNHDMRIGYYTDTYRRTADGWRLHTRAMTFLRKSGGRDSGRAHDPTRPQPTAR